MTRRRRIVIAASALAFVVVAVLSYRWFISPRTDAPGSADAIVVLAGGGDRNGFALDLAREGVAPDVVFASAFVEDQNVWAATGCNTLRPAGLPEETTIECFEPHPATTRGEVREIAQLAEARDWDTLVVVASTDQITRARLLLSRCWDGEARFTGPHHDQPWPVRVAYEWGALLKAQLLRGC